MAKSTKRAFLELDVAWRRLLWEVAREMPSWLRRLLGAA